MKKIVLCLIMGVILIGLTSCQDATPRDFYGMELADNFYASNVDYDKLVAFLEADWTNANSFTLGGYDCRHFAHDLHNNAEAEGIRCAVVWKGDRSHVFNAFKTIDKGIVFVDASSGIDGVAYDLNGQLAVDAMVREGVGEKVIYFLGDPTEFTIEW